MTESEHESPASQGSWTAFMCPCCRGLFRSSTQAGQTVTCPLCETKIQLETRTKNVVHEEQNEAPPLQRRRRSPRQETTQSWDQDSSQQKNQTNNTGIIWASLFLLSVGVAVGAFFIIQTQKQRLNDKNSGSQSNAFKVPDQGVYTNDGSGTEGSNEPLLQLEHNHIELAREAAKQFLSCETIEEFPPLIRDPERVMPLVREYYQTTPYQPIGALSVDKREIAEVVKRFTSFEVILKNYTSRPIAVELADEGPLVDWESWVSYCEIPWESFIEGKVQKETLVRVQASHDFYFNFQFSDDSKWTCFRLTRSPDEPILFGYVPRDAPFLKALLNQEALNGSLRLKVRFPDNPVTDNQILITDFVGAGWVNGL